jgi:hypothetical protein
MDINETIFWGTIFAKAYLKYHVISNDKVRIIPLHGNMLVLFIESISTPIKCTVLGNWRAALIM